MKVQLLVCALISISSNVSAYTKVMAQEFLKRNVDIQTSRFGLQGAKLTYELEDNKRDWTLSLSSEYANSSLMTSPSSFYSLDNKVYTNSLSLQKDTIFGASFALSSSLVNGEYSGVDQSGYTQSLTYKQDLGKNFFGRNDYLSLDSKRELFEAAKYENNDEIQAKLFLFLSDYMEASLSRSVVDLQKKALERSVRRLEFISKKVRDGVKEKADLYSAKTGELYAKESLRSAKSDFIKRIEKIRKYLHRKIDEGEINLLSKIDLNLSGPPMDINYKNNEKVKSMQSKFLSFEKEFKKRHHQVMPDVGLILSYTTNDFNKTKSKAFSDGTFGSDNKEYKVGVEVSLPFGFSVEKSAKSLALIDMLNAQNQIKKAIEDVEAELESVISQYKIVSDNLTSATQRSDLAQKALDEYNKLYQRGRATLDQVINAEERLIETQISKAQYQAQKNILSLGLYYLNSSLLTIVR